MRYFLKKGYYEGHPRDGKEWEARLGIGWGDGAVDAAVVAS